MKTLGFNTLTNDRKSYRWGDVLQFTGGGSAMPYCGDGWATPEEGIVWTQSQNARLSFAISPPKSDISLILSCLPFIVEPTVLYQELHIFANFLRVGFGVIREPGEFEFKIPARIFDVPDLDIDFYLPRACSPAAIGSGADIRDLGLAVNQLIMIEG